MGCKVVMGAQCCCPMGSSPGSLMALPTHGVLIDDKPPLTIMDHVPLLNIPSFGMCQSIMNPVVAAATAASLGTLTPMPCIPNTPAPWASPDVKGVAGGIPLLDQGGHLMCAWGGNITITNPGQTKLIS